VDVIEAVRNHLAGQDFDAAAPLAMTCLQVMARSHQSAGLAAFAAEVLDVLPIGHGAYASIADAEARSRLALGFTDEALARYQALLRLHEQRAGTEPERADYQRDLSVSYNKLGDLHQALGQGDKAREYFEKALAIRERLARAEPERADYQVDLAISLVRIGERVHLERAFRLLSTLRKEGRLEPRHEGLLASVERLLAE
jgi:tetratricopeptide (TPR) repeat protein